MLTILSICDKEAEQALDLAKWMGELGGCANHECLLSVNKRMSDSRGYEPILLALKLAFREVSLYVQFPEDERPGPVGGLAHVFSANNAFIRVNKDVIQNAPEKPYLWLEADAIPLTPDWQDKLWSEYFACGRPFMGDRVLYPNVPEHMSGVAIYKQIDFNCPSYVLSQTNAWDVVAAAEILPKAHFTRLIQHEWRPDSFPSSEDLNRLRSEAVIYHQCKDGSLMARLRERKAGVAKPSASPSQPSASNPEVLLLMAKIKELEDRLNSSSSRSTKSRKTAKRSASEQAKIDARMAKARAARKAKVVA